MNDIQYIEQIASRNIQTSSLYSLNPEGLGSPYIESLTSYISHLAREHNILTGILINKILAPSTKKVFDVISECFEKKFNYNEDLVYEYMGMDPLLLCTNESWRTKIYWDELLKFSYCTGVGLGELFTKDKIDWYGREIRYPV